MHNGFGGVQKEKILLSILSENYETIYYVNFDEDTIEPYRMSKIIEKRFGDFLREIPSFQEAMLRYIEEFVAPIDKEEMLKRADIHFLKEKLEKRRAYSYDYRVNWKDKQYYYRFKISNLDGVGELHHAVVGFANVTSEMDRVNLLVESQAMLSVLERDQLTGLYSKEFFFKKVEQYIANHPEEDYMLWCSDVQGLKVINEKYGMEKGDEVLKALAAGSHHFPGFVFGGRIEGDKFSALMVDNHPDFELVNRLMNEEGEQDFPVPNVVVKHGVYHIQKNDTLSIQGMYDRAVLALQSIKNVYGYCVAEYDDKLRRDLLVNRQVVEDAKKALENGEFKVFFQPKIDLNKGCVGGAEALVRWIHPELGFMNPGIFIPLFEQNGFIVKLDFYIWEEVCRAIIEWKEKNIPLVPISVNVSRRDFENPNLAEEIIELVGKYGIEHSLFQIEITESSYVDDPERIETIIKKLHDAGFVIALDDFGTGYSSMLALSSLDLDIMKLDMSLIQNDIPGTEKNVLEFSMQLAKMMQLKTVAEGVETHEQVSRVQSLGGDFIQGYFYSKPIPKEEFESYLKKDGLKSDT